MATYRVNMDQLAEPERAILQAAANADDVVRILQSVCNTLAEQQGMGVGNMRNDLSDAAKSLYNRVAVCLCNLHVGLRNCVIEGTQSAESSVKLKLEGISDFIISGEKLIPFDHTEYYVDNSNHNADKAAVTWANVSLTGGVKVVAAETINYIAKLINPKAGEVIEEVLPENVDEKYMKKSLEKLVDTLANNKTYMEKLKKEFDESVEGLDAIWELWKRCITSGKSFASIYDNVKEFDQKEIDTYFFFHDKDNVAFFDELAKPLQDLGDIEGSIEMAYNVLNTIFKDYTEQLFYIEKIREAMKEMGCQNELVDECINDLINKYRNSVLAGWEEAAEVGLGKITDKGIDKILNVATGGIFSAVKYSFDLGKYLGNAITGLGDQGNMIGELYASQQYSGVLVAQYERYADKIRSGSYTQEDVVQCEMYMQMAAEAKLSEFKLLKELFENVHAWGEDAEKVNNYIGNLETDIARLEKITGKKS